MNRIAVSIVAMATSLLIGVPVGFAADFPSHPVHIIAAFPAGGGVDAIARYVAKSVTDQLGQTLVVENRPGAGGGVAAVYVKDKPADGYTVISTISSTMASEPVFQKLEYGKGDFTYVASVLQFQAAIVALPDLKWNDLGSLLNSDEAKTGDLTYASQTTFDRLVMENINSVPPHNISIVPFKGGADIIAAILGGHVTMGWSGTLHVPLIAAGKMKALAVPGDKRYASYPDTPTLAELGFPNAYNVYSIFAVPKGTPDDVVTTLSQAIQKAAQEPGFAALCDQYNFKVDVLNSADTAALIDRQYEQTKAAFESSGK